MAFITTTETAGKERNKLVKEIVVTIRELIKQKTTDDNTKAMMVFIADSLGRIWQTIDESVAAWEKRDYWIKAERFRQEWSWTEIVSRKLSDAVENNDFASAAMLIADTAQRFSNVTVSEKHRLGKPWLSKTAVLGNG